MESVQCHSLVASSNHTPGWTSSLYQNMIKGTSTQIENLFTSYCSIIY